MVALRGQCTFGTKGLNVAQSPAAALVIVNNEDGITHMPAPDAAGLSEFTHDNGGDGGDGVWWGIVCLIAPCLLHMVGER